ncbi:MAG: LLM class flavin-dependent oxidoreductase [Dehalococcoidia bacterium]|nr:LLM class flavin-dependent oxidoreductase [Dehalococcoidia bacterium]
MHVGVSVVFQNPTGRRSDHDVYRDELHLADLAEPLGFESIWGVEHHFTGYTMSPNVLQFLTYMAGRTTIQLGSMVLVLPWHDPVRVAEEAAFLDNVSDGRLILGIGRGLGRVEFDGFRIDMNESRERFVESAQVVLNGLENGYVEADGEFYKIPRRNLRPAPFKTFKGRTYAAAVSPESAQIMARLGIGMLIIPQKPWENLAEDLASYREIYREVNNEEPPPPLVAGWTYCDEDEGRARDVGHRYIRGYYDTVLDHYDLAGDHLGKTNGYEYYGKMSRVLNTHGDAARDFFAELQVYGTPDQCIEKIMDIRERVACETFIAVFRYADMPVEESERSMRLFAEKVMPRLQAVGAPVSVA